MTLRALFIISKSGRSKPPLIFGPIIVVCLILSFVFQTNSEIAEGEYRCVVDKLGEDGYSTIQGEIS